MKSLLKSVYNADLETLRIHKKYVPPNYCFYLRLSQRPSHSFTHRLILLHVHRSNLCQPRPLFYVTDFCFSMHFFYKNPASFCYFFSTLNCHTLNNTSFLKALCTFCPDFFCTKKGIFPSQQERFFRRYIYTSSYSKTFKA